MKRLLALAAAAACLAACQTMTVERQQVASLSDGSAYAEVRTVRDPMYMTDSINDTLELWGVNQSSGTVCVGYRSNYGSWHVFTLSPGQTSRLLALGQSAQGTVGIHRTTGGCEAAQFD